MGHYCAYLHILGKEMTHSYLTYFPIKAISSINLDSIYLQRLGFLTFCTDDDLLQCIPRVLPTQLEKLFETPSKPLQVLRLIKQLWLHKRRRL